MNLASSVANTHNSCGESFNTQQAHRMQRVGLCHKITCYNDSRATNLNATWYSLTQCPKNTIWIVGSMKNFKEYLLLEPVMLEQYKKVKALIILGESTVWHLLQKEISVIINCDKENLIPFVRALAIQGDTILFSPACASFDLFENYEARGIWFNDQMNLHF